MEIEVTLRCKMCKNIHYRYPIDGFDLDYMINHTGWEIGEDEDSDICPDCLVDRKTCAICSDTFFENEEEDAFIALDAFGLELALCPEHTRYHAMYRQPSLLVS